MRFTFFVSFIYAISLSSIANAAVSDFKENFAVAVAAENHGFSLGLSPSDQALTREIRYLPNVVAVTGFELTAYRLTLAYKTAAARIPDEDRKKGATSYDDFRGAISLGSKDEFMVVGYYNRFSGLYIENTVDIDPSYAGSDLFIQRSDITALNIGLGVIYVWSPEKFSLSASMFQSRRQTESAGSLLLVGGYDRSKFEAPISLIPSQRQSDFGAEAQISAGEFTTASLSVGYGYSYILHSFFLTGLAAAGPGYQWRRYTVSGTDFSSTTNASKIILAASLGYNGDRFFSAVSLINNATEFNTSHVRFRTQMMSLRLALGLRF